MKWRSKATGTEFEAYDSFQPAQKSYWVMLKPEGSEHYGPYLTYAELIEAFEKVEDEEPIREGMYDGWDTE